MGRCWPRTSPRRPAQEGDSVLAEQPGQDDPDAGLDMQVQPLNPVGLDHRRQGLVGDAAGCGRWPYLRVSPARPWVKAVSSQEAGAGTVTDVTDAAAVPFPAQQGDPGLWARHRVQPRPAPIERLQGWPVVPALGRRGTEARPGTCSRGTTPRPDERSRPAPGLIARLDKLGGVTLASSAGMGRVVLFGRG